jgi:hypothetical protein
MGCSQHTLRNEYCEIFGYDLGIARKNGQRFSIETKLVWSPLADGVFWDMRRETPATNNF